MTKEGSCPILFDRKWTKTPQAAVSLKNAWSSRAHWDIFLLKKKRTIVREAVQFLPFPILFEILFRKEGSVFYP